MKKCHISKFWVELVRRYVAEFGLKNWGAIGAKIAGRTGKQCRERWHNQLDPTIKKEPWSEHEEEILMKAHSTVYLLFIYSK